MNASYTHIVQSFIQLGAQYLFPFRSLSPSHPFCHVSLSCICKYLPPPPPLISVVLSPSSSLCPPSPLPTSLFGPSLPSPGISSFNWHNREPPKRYFFLNFKSGQNVFYRFQKHQAAVTYLWGPQLLFPSLWVRVLRRKHSPTPWSRADCGKDRCLHLPSTLLIECEVRSTRLASTSGWPPVSERRAVGVTSTCVRSAPVSPRPVFQGKG